MRSLSSYDYPAIARNLANHAWRPIGAWQRRVMPYWGLSSTLAVLLLIVIGLQWLLTEALMLVEGEDFQPLEDDSP